jgi:hypothetical protein
MFVVSLSKQNPCGRVLIGVGMLGPGMRTSQMVLSLPLQGFGHILFNIRRAVLKHDIGHIGSTIRPGSQVNPHSITDVVTMRFDICEPNCVRLGNCFPLYMRKVKDLLRCSLLTLAMRSTVIPLTYKSPSSKAIKHIERDFAQVVLGLPTPSNDFSMPWDSPLQSP